MASTAIVTETGPAILEIFDGLPGRYQLGPDLIVEIRREGTRLVAQPTGRPH